MNQAEENTIRPKLLIFDLDGTLIDSSRDLVECINATIQHCGLPPLGSDRICSFIGDGAATLVERSLQAAAGDPAYRHSEALGFFLHFYREHLLDHTVAYPGVLQTLSRIHSSPGAPLMAVLTNKPVNPSRHICQALGIAPYLFANYGGNSFATKKPNPDGLRSIVREAESTLHRQLRPDEVVMVGDSEVDIRTAVQAGVTSWGCTWGFATEKMLAESPDFLAHSPDDWLTLLNTVKAKRVNSSGESRRLR